MKRRYINIDHYFFKLKTALISGIDYNDIWSKVVEKVIDQFTPELASVHFESINQILM